MPVDLQEIADLLKREYLFQDLTDEQVLWIASQFKPLTLGRDTVIYSQGAPADNFYFVFRGKVRVYRNVRGREVALNILGPGDFFGEEGVLFDRPRDATIVTVETTRLLRMERAQFALMIKAYPKIRENLLATAESRRLARSRSFDWLGPDEVIYYICRKHDLFLFRKLIIPILLGVAAVPVLALGIADQTPFLRTGADLLGTLMLLFALLLGLWGWLDWENDYYIVTNKSVIWSEKIYGLYESRREAPLESILAVNVISSQLGRIFKYGSVNVRTYTGGILMRDMAHPTRFASFVEGYKKRALQISKQEEMRIIEQELEKALARRVLEKTDGPQIPVDPPPLVERNQTEEIRRRPLRDVIRTFLTVRYAQGNIITYRKHWFILLQKAWKPLLILAALSVLLWMSISSGILTGGGAGISLLLTAVLIIVWLVISGWLLYEYFDWSNDIYRLTPQQIFDISRKPLGQEIKKSAPLESILSIEHERDNIIGIILNFGTVTINVGQTQLVFHGVYNPDQVHADISDYKEALNRKKREAEAAREREQMVNWLVAYHEKSEQLSEFDNNTEWDQFSG